jgi:hypothetical protein
MSVTYRFVPFSVTVSEPVVPVAGTRIGSLQLPILTADAVVEFEKPAGPVTVKP